MSHAKDKRKQEGDDVVPETQKKAREEVTDEEVEEFYAILRRINMAVKYFKSTRDDVAALEKEIMQEVKGATMNGNEEDTEKNLSLDLNLTPTTPT
ncbi:hypothetical protein VNO77_12094 [Canavalia gladiata]|uniref:Uncharacterized protein n=1 Tax=Canavalia gladiata TaxID=3824 RepID=A0AAN9M0B1_CANGL